MKCCRYIYVGPTIILRRVEHLKVQSLWRKVVSCITVEILQVAESSRNLKFAVMLIWCAWVDSYIVNIVANCVIYVSSVW